MRRHLLSLLLFIVSGTALGLTVARDAASDARLALAVLPCTDIEATFRKFRPLLGYVNQAAGITLKLVVPASLADLEALLENGQVDVALQDPHTYLSVSRFFDRTTLLWTVGQDGTTSQVGAVIVRRDSGVTGLRQLRGRTVLFGPRTSTPKWVAATRLFESAGIDVVRDLKAASGTCCEDIAFAVLLRSVDAGVVCDHFLTGHVDKQRHLGVDTSALEVIARTAPFPTRVLAVRRGAPRAAGALAAAFLALDPMVAEDARILSAAEIRGFKRVAEADYVRLIGSAAPGRVR